MIGSILSFILGTVMITLGVVNIYTLSVDHLKNWRNGVTTPMLWFIWLMMTAVFILCIIVGFWILTHVQTR